MSNRTSAAAAQPPKSACAHSYRLTLVSFPPARKAAVVRTIAVLAGLDSARAKRLAESTPAPITPAVSGSRLSKVLYALDVTGAVVTVERVGEERDRFLVPEWERILSHMTNIGHRLADQHLYDFRPDIEPASVVIREAIEGLGFVQRELEEWRATYAAPSARRKSASPGVTGSRPQRRPS